jgi:arginase
MSQGLNHLQVIGVRYRGSTFAENDERALDAYRESGVYAQAEVPFEIVEVQMPEAKRVAFEPDNLGIINGEIAQAVADALRADRAVLMTGGDCTHATGMFGGLQDVYGADARIGLVWFDAHGDFNTPHTTLSGMLGGMPVAVCAGLAYPRWRNDAHIRAPLPTDRILFVDVRNLDVPEEQLLRSTDAKIAAVADGFPGEKLQYALSDLASRCDKIYFHIDADILDESYVPNHGTKEPNGPNMQQVQDAITAVMATGKVAVAAVVSVYASGEGRDTSVASGIELIRGVLNAWSHFGRAG